MLALIKVWPSEELLKLNYLSVLMCMCVLACLYVYNMCAGAKRGGLIPWAGARGIDGCKLPDVFVG